MPPPSQALLCASLLGNFSSPAAGPVARLMRGMDLSTAIGPRPNKGRRMQGLAICAGIGGLELGVKQANPAYRTVCYIEREAYSSAVLASRMAEGKLCDAPIWSDLATFDPRPWRRKVDCVTAGYPCQPFSVAGRRQGADDPRHLWPTIKRIVAVIQPSIVFCENVPGHVSLGLRQVWGDLRKMGYVLEADIFSAAEQGAPHVRKRLFLLAAHADSNILRQQSKPRTGRAGASKPRKHGEAWNLADADDTERRPDGALDGSLGDPLYRLSHGRQQGHRQSSVSSQDVADRASLTRGQSQTSQIPGTAQSRLGHAFDGVSSGMGESRWINGWEDGVSRTTAGCEDRAAKLRCLGNAVVPQVAAFAYANLQTRLESAFPSSFCDS
jgi:DNA (cytosine-5)-methyltransferase 1